jgi:hypothetical protein
VAADGPVVVASAAVALADSEVVVPEAVAPPEAGR